MAKSKRTLRRRTLRPADAPTLVEGAMTRTDSNDYIMLEIAGGPPHVTATVFVGGAVCQHVALNGCGTGSARVATTSNNPRVEIAIEGLVLLTGRLPAAPSVARSGA